MKQKWLKWLLIVSLLVGIQVAGMIIVDANEESNTGEVEAKWWWNKDKDRNNPEDPEELPQPEGGPEFTERVRQPVSNIILQQRYPETVVLRGAEGDNRVALTFDDGPDPRFTPTVLDVLAEYNVPATFFVMGARAEVYPDIVRRMINEGHIVGNHTRWHPNLVLEGDIETLEREVMATEDILQDIVGYRTSLFRPPYGFLFDELVERLAELNYTVVGWDVDSLDWRELGAEDTAYNVLSNTRPGSIILMHDGGDWESDRTSTIEALDLIIPALQAQGIEFVTVPELLGIPYQK
ncbi:polysaccharide deacetylase family protein [Alkalihalobacillus sp. MEB130]|uniref:polysaccharide deacetylase family protein n=1 Tax=Alkalihalobacillus sp. MEB130 TaxID=2976704 RepID=UPI0028DDA926|nr:polysaccharide deacetylase family protein [Alkalihalobacillus sp. MEB130]MDT8861051.1 polysaccharide deacetylase family protein [Alkalihalobacillus sp. MEB130]